MNTYEKAHISQVTELFKLGVRKTGPKENCPPVRVTVWFRISVRIRAGGQFS